MHRNVTLFQLGYTPPELHEGRTWYVDYYVLDDQGLPVRKRVKLNRIRSIPQRRAYARQLIAELTRKLRSGWRPNTDPGTARGHKTLEQACEDFLRFKEQDLRHSSGQYYRSYVRSFTTWALREGLADQVVPAFTTAHAAAYMDHLQLDRQLSARTWNNYRVFQAVLFNWMVAKSYVRDNPFKGIRKRRTVQKKRTFLTEEERAQLVHWLAANDPAFLLPCLFVYHTLIRPRELTRLLVEHVDLDAQVLHLPGAITKNGEEATVAIPDAMIPHLEELRGAKPTWYVMGKDFRPGPKPAHRNSYQRRWIALRTALGWSSDKQLYSLRDSGIIQLLRDGCDLLHVMRQARHKEVGTTNKYLQHAFPEGVREVRTKATALGRIVNKGA